MPLMYLESMVDGAMKGIGEQKAAFRYSVWDAVLRIGGGGGAAAPVRDAGLSDGDAYFPAFTPAQPTPGGCCFPAVQGTLSAAGWVRRCWLLPLPVRQGGVCAGRWRAFRHRGCGNSWQC